MVAGAEVLPATRQIPAVRYQRKLLQIIDAVSELCQVCCHAVVRCQSRLFWESWWDSMMRAYYKSLELILSADSICES